MNHPTQQPQSYEELKTDAELLRHMLEETTSARDVWAEDDFRPLLRHQLQTRIDAQLIAPGAVAALYTFGALLSDPKPDPAILLSLKDFAKYLRTDTTTGFPAPIATVLYYASIVAAEKRAGVKISGLEDPLVEEGCTWALAQPWLTDDLRALFGLGLGHRA